MKSNLKLWVALIVVAIIAIGAYYYPAVKQVIDQNTGKPVPIGAVSTLDGVDNPYASVGGYKYYYYNQAMSATSSVPCSIKNPFNATSTLVSYKFQVTTNGIATAQTLDVSTSTSAYASSTPSYVRAFPTGTGQFSGVWQGVTATTTPHLIGYSQTQGGIYSTNIGTTDNIIGPSDYITLRVATSSAGSFGSYYTGTCSGIIEQL